MIKMRLLIETSRNLQAFVNSIIVEAEKLRVNFELIEINDLYAIIQLAGNFKEVKTLEKSIEKTSS